MWKTLYGAPLAIDVYITSIAGGRLGTLTSACFCDLSLGLDLSSWTVARSTFHVEAGLTELVHVHVAPCRSTMYGTAPVDPSY